MLGLAACGDGADQRGPGCIAGAQESCMCADGSFGAAVCLADGSGLGLCMCGGAATMSGTDGATDSATDSATDGNTSMPADDDDTPPPPDPVCGDGVEEPGECTEASAVYCPEDCPEPTGGSSTGTTACVNFAGFVPSIPSVWQSGATTGFDAGGLLCEAMGFDHVCDYRELAAAVDKEELAALQIGETLWVHRTTVELVGKENSGAELGGRCVDWTYGENTLSDGEYLEMTAEGPVFNLDSDTFYDGLDPSHAAPGVLECGGVMRGVPCCNPDCPLE